MVPDLTAFLTLHRKLRLSIRIPVVSVVLFAALFTAGIAIGLQYHFSRSMAMDAAVASYQVAARHTSEFFQIMDRRTTQATRILSRYPHLPVDQLPDPARDASIAELFAEVMRNNPLYSSIYLGLANGDFLEVINLDSSPEMREYLKASASDRWVVNRVGEVQGTRMRQLDYFDSGFRWQRQRQEPSQYDARQRRWYSDAEHGKVNKTQPYIFHYPQVPGQTYSIRLPHSEVVLGIDITLQSLSDYLRRQPLSREGEIYLYKASGEILASNHLGTTEHSLAELAPLPLSAAEQQYLSQLGVIKISNQLDWPPIDFAVAGQPRGYTIDLLRLAAARLGVEVNFINGYSWAEILANYEQGQLDIVQPIADNVRNRERGYLSEPIVHLPLALALRAEEGMAQPTSVSLAALRGKTLAIPRGWSSIYSIHRAYPDIAILEVNSPRAALEAVRDGRAYATLDSSAVLHYTASQYFIEGLVYTESVDTGKAELPEAFHLLMPPHLQPLGKLLEKSIATMDSTRKAHLQQKWLLSANNAGDGFITVPYKPLLGVVGSTGAQRRHPLSFEIAGTEHLAYVEPLNPDSPASDYFAVVVPAAKVLGDSLLRVRWSVLITVGCVLLILPFSWSLAELIVRPINRLHDKSIRVKERRYAEITYRPSRLKEIDELLWAMVDMSQSIQHYEKSQQQLMDAFIELIAEAIDEKSPYTGGHCERVPILALMLADKATATNEGALSHFRFDSEEAYREFKIAAWLHDCGKITMPEHIVDKGSKLETIYNRIHEIRMRFEVLWRDAEIDCLNAVAADPTRVEQYQAELQHRRQRLREDFSFIANSNVGGEFLSDQAQQRISELGKITWTRYFDDRLGLSPVEELRLKAIPAQAVPALEHLLADKPEHLIARQRSASHDPSWGIKMEVPEYLYNLGEIYNLSISRGTLTTEDRFKINEHIIGTIRMLEKLPFPPELKRVPRYASTHHETMKGTGYPRKLCASDLSIPERILVIADIFEALTAADRPYKKAKSLSESIEIMYKMMLDQHMDQDLFELFLTSGIYREYAERFLAAGQIDEVSIERYLRQPSPTQV